MTTKFGGSGDSFAGKCSALLALLLLGSSVLAHDLYLIPARFVVQEAMLLRVDLQNGDSFPESEISPVLERVRDMKLLSASGATDLENLHVEGNAVRGGVRISSAPSFVLTARTVPHSFSLPAKEFNAYLKEEGLQHVIEWRREHGKSEMQGRERYAKYGKSLLTTGGNNEFHTRPTGLAFEFVPESSPYDLKDGDALPVRLLLRGKPAAGVQVETSWAGNAGERKTEIVGRTDEAGRIVIPLGAVGKWRIHAVSMEPCADAQVADWESNWASMTFEIQKDAASSGPANAPQHLD